MDALSKVVLNLNCNLYSYKFLKNKQTNNQTSGKYICVYMYICIYITKQKQLFSKPEQECSNKNVTQNLSDVTKETFVSRFVMECMFVCCVDNLESDRLA